MSPNPGFDSRRDFLRDAGMGLGPLALPWMDLPEDATYVASGEVEGTIADRWSMDAVGGSLRVAERQAADTGGRAARQ